MEQEELNKRAGEYQIVQEQLQSVSIQMEQFKTRQIEYKEALEETEKASGTIYKSVGGFFIEVSKEDALKDIKDKQEFTEMRLKSIEKQYSDLTAKEKDMRTKLSSAIGEAQGGKPGNGA